MNRLEDYRVTLERAQTAEDDRAHVDRLQELAILLPWLDQVTPLPELVDLATAWHERTHEQPP